MTSRAAPPTGQATGLATDQKTGLLPTGQAMELPTGEATGLANGRQGRRPVHAVPTGLVVLGLLVSGFSARPSVTSTSAELPTVVAALGGSAVLTGLVSALPPLVFAAGSFIAPPVIARLGVSRALAAAALTAALGLLLRVSFVTTPVFLGGTVVALAGVAVANVALPTAVKRHLPDRTGAGTAAYTLMLAAGTAVAAAVTVPLGALLGGWRAGLGMWAVVAAVAALPWLAVSRTIPDRAERARATEARAEMSARVTAARAGGAPKTTGPATVFGVRHVARTRVGRAVAVLFAGQAASSYVYFAYLPTIATDAGRTREVAGLLLGWFAALGIVSALVPLLAGRLPDQRALIVVLAGLWVVGDLGFAFAPGAAWVWATASGLGASLFTVALLLVPLRTSTVAGSAALSAYSQGVAYLVSASFVFGAGVVRDLTGGWTVVLVGLAVVMLPVAWAGTVAGRVSVVEDDRSLGVSRPGR